MQNESIFVKEGEARKIKFSITESGSAVDCTGAEFKYYVESEIEGVYLLQKENADFDISEVASGIVYIDLDTTDTSHPVGSYNSELMITFSATSIEKSRKITYVIEDAIIE